MLIAEAARIAAASIRASKERAVYRARGRVDVGWLVEAYRGDQPVATITAEAPDRDTMMGLLDLVAQGFGADIVSLSTEAWYADGKTAEVLDPRTGQSWEYGAMASYVEEFGLDGVVNEGLHTLVANRAGDLHGIAQPYVVTGRKIEWKPGYPEETEHAGWIPETMLKIMDRHLAAVTRLVTEIGPMMGVGAEQARHHLDLATARLVGDRSSGCALDVVLYAPKGSARDQILRRSLSRRQVVDPGRRDY
jgi:hypothetical protein